jgi:hypothetical protein
MKDHNDPCEQRKPLCRAVAPVQCGLRPLVQSMYLVSEQSHPATGGVIGASSNEAQAIRDARFSIEKELIVF